MTLIQNYKARVETQDFVEDPAQLSVLDELQTLSEQLNQYRPPTPQKLGWGMLRKRPSSTQDMPQGLYIWGGVGRGKSMLMDLFYEHLTVEKKHRIHFHAFMLKVHAQLHAWRQQHKGPASQEIDPLPPLAQTIAKENYVLCLDEFQVTDVADAVILARLFGLLLELGVVVVTTSNLPPDALYRDGLQRDYFLKFVSLAQKRWKIIELASARDYRLQHLKAMKQVYFSPLGKNAEIFLQDAFSSMTCHAQKEKISLPVLGRTLDIFGHGDVAWCSFSELCERPLGSADYLEIAREFHTLLLGDIPAMPPEMRNEASRFVKLIDSLYDHRVKLICTADAAPQELYIKGDTAFEFERTASRLMEMQSEQYLASSHIVC